MGLIDPNSDQLITRSLRHEAAEHTGDCQRSSVPETVHTPAEFCVCPSGGRGAAWTKSNLPEVNGSSGLFLGVDEDGGHVTRPGRPLPAAPAATVFWFFCGALLLLRYERYVRHAHTNAPGALTCLRPPDKAAETEAVPMCLPPLLHHGPCRPPLLALLCNSHGRPAAQQREAFIFGHKAHQIQLFWKG